MPRSVTSANRAVPPTDPDAVPGPPNASRRAPTVKPTRAAPAGAKRVTRAEINLAHVRHNYRELTDVLQADADIANRPRAQVWGVLKADGYGHGATAVATALQNTDIAGLCVALLEEGVELRNAGVRLPILVLGGYWDRRRDGIEALIEHRLTPVVYQRVQLQQLAATLAYMEVARQDVHLQIDTGMRRLGVPFAELREVADELQQQPRLHLHALMTHFACAEAADEAVNQQQLAMFSQAQQQLATMGVVPQALHVANSAAVLRSPDTHLDIVRPGLALFGVHPCPTASSRCAHRAKLKPAMRVLTEVVALRDVPQGQAIGYGHQWRAQRASRIATIPMGYADGLSRSLSNHGAVLIGGKRAPIVGTVSMDLTMVDVTEHPGVTLRDEVVFMGEQQGRLGEDCITAHEIAEHSGTIAWESLTSISRRVPRFYRQP